MALYDCEMWILSKRYSVRMVRMILVEMNQKMNREEDQMKLYITLQRIQNRSNDTSSKTCVG